MMLYLFIVPNAITSHVLSWFGCFMTGLDAEVKRANVH